MIEHLKLQGLDGLELHLFSVYKHPEGEHLEADGYVALKAQPEGTVYTVPAGAASSIYGPNRPYTKGYGCSRGT